MKKLFALLIGVCFIAIVAKTQGPSTPSHTNQSPTISMSSYKACIEACNACLASSKSCEKMCNTMDTKKLATCIQLCKESQAICAATSQLMTLDSESAKAVSKECAVICGKCAMECDKSDMAVSKKCASDCREVVKLCNGM